MDIITDGGALKKALFQYWKASCPAEMQDGLLAIILEPVDAETMTKAGPFLYAHYDLLDAAGKTLCGQFFKFADDSHWTTYNEQNRSADVVQAVRRDLGEKGKFPDPKDDPQPNVALREDGVNWHPAAPEPVADAAVSAAEPAPAP